MSVDKEENEVNKGGRPPYEPNDKDRGMLEAFMAVGFPLRQISLYMHRNIQTLRKHYPDIFESNDREDKTNMVENALWYNAVYKHNVVAQLAWLKAHRKELYSEKVQSAANDQINPQELFKEISTGLPH